MRYFLTFCYTIILFQAASAQGNIILEIAGKPTDSAGVSIVKDHRLDSIVSVHRSINAERQSIPGYRVQIFFGSERKKANDIKSEFLKKYPAVDTYLIYQQPNYKIRVGNFRTRLEAYDFYRKLPVEFSSSFVVKDQIRMQKIE